MKIKILPLLIAATLAATLLPGEADARSGRSSSSFSRPSSGGSRTSSPSRTNTTSPSRTYSAPTRSSTTPTYTTPTIRSSPSPASAPVHRSTTPIIIAPEIEIESAPPVQQVPVYVPATPPASPSPTPVASPVTPTPILSGTPIHQGVGGFMNDQSTTPAGGVSTVFPGGTVDQEKMDAVFPSESDNLSPLLEILKVLAVCGGVAGLILGLAFLISKLREQAANRPTEMEDNKLTVFRFQVAFSSEGNEQVRNSIGAAIETTDGDVRKSLAAGKVIALKLSRIPESITHAQLEVATCTCEKAEEVYDRFVSEEQSKFTSDAYANIKGVVFRDGVDITDVEAEAPGHCFVMTWVIALEHNKLPFSTEVNSLEQVMNVLASIQSLFPDNVCGCGMLIHPGDGPGLSQDEFLQRYGKMTRLG